MRIIGLLALHAISLYLLRLLWKDKNAAIQRGGVLTRIGYVSKKKSPRLFSFSIRVDFVVLAILYAGLIAYSIVLLAR